MSLRAGLLRWGLLSFISLLPALSNPRPAAQQVSLPVWFEPCSNSGDALFTVRGGGAPSLLLPDGARYANGVRLRILGGEAGRVKGLDALRGRTNYLRSRDPAGWRLGVANYRRVRYESVYPGIDMVFHGARGRLEYDFVLAPAADPARIRLRIEGAARLALNAAGDLEADTGLGRVTHHKPVAYQIARQEKRLVEAAWVLHGENEVSFRAGAHDPELPLVIDPEILYASYLGGKDATSPLTPADAVTGIASDSAGMIYVAGVTMSLDFPRKAFPSTPQYGYSNLYYEDVFITKIDPATGDVLYSAVIGGSGTDIAYGLRVDEAGAAYVTGRAGTGFPYASMLDPQCEKSPRTMFALKLAPEGDRLEYAACVCADSYGTALSLGSGNSVFVAGYYTSITSPSPSLPVTPGAFQAEPLPSSSGKSFVARLNAAGELQFATWLSGNGDNAIMRLAAGPDDGVVVLGGTTSNVFPVVNAMQPINRSGGGVTVTRDGGQTWEPRNAGLATSRFTKVVADPFTAGTAYIFSSSTGVLKTVDWGQTWVPSNDGIVPTPYPNVSDLVAAAVPGRLYALAGGRAYRSDDGALTWNPITMKPNCMALIADTMSADGVYAVIAIPPAGGTGSPASYVLMASSDAGATWRGIASEMSFTMMPTLVPDRSTSGGLYLSANASLYRSTDGGASWQYVNNTGPLSRVDGVTPSPGNGFAPDPRTPGVVYVWALGVPDPVKSMFTLVKTTDGGYSWSVCGGFPEQAIGLWVDSAESAVVWVLTRRGIYRSEDACATFQPRNAGLPGQYLTSAAQHPTDSSTLWILASPASEMFLASLTADGTAAAFSTFLGTRDAETPYGLAVGANGDIYLAGYTNSAEWPTTEGAFIGRKPGLYEAGFVMRLTPAADAVVASTYFGGARQDVALALALAPDGDVWVGGQTQSAAFPLRDPLQTKLSGPADAFLALLSPDLTTLKFSTFLGGSGVDQISVLALDPSGNLLAAGPTNSRDSQVTPQAAQPQYAGDPQDVFLWKVKPPPKEPLPQSDGPATPAAAARTRSSAVRRR